MQEGGASRHRLLPWVRAAYPFVTVREERLQELIDTMVSRDILHEADAVLSLGHRGERLYGRKNFFELYAVFTSPAVMRVQHGKEEVGFVQTLFVSMHDQTRGPLSFRLAGRAWEVVQADWSRGTLYVKAAEDGRVPTWLGFPGVLSITLCQAMMEVLLNRGEEHGWLSDAAAGQLASMRQSYAGLLEPGTASVEEHPDGVQWHTFAGGAVNRLLAAGLESLSTKRWIAGNLSVRCKDIQFTAANDAIRALPNLDWEQIAAGAARSMARGMLSKFQPCLPQHAEDRLLAERLLDLSTTLHFLGTVKVNGVRVAMRPGATRLTDPETTGAMPLDFALLTTPGRFATPQNAISWVDTPAAVRAAVGDLRNAEVVGFDVETTLDSATVCLLQIAIPGTTYLIDPFAVGDLDPLVCVLNAPTPTKVIHNASFERRVLAAMGIMLDGVFDTMKWSRRLRGIDALGGHSLAMVCERELGLALNKAAQTSNWCRRPLDREQLCYAALDAEVLLALHQCLSI